MFYFLDSFNFPRNTEDLKEVRVHRVYSVSIYSPHVLPNLNDSLLQNTKEDTSRISVTSHLTVDFSETFLRVSSFMFHSRQQHEGE